MISRPKRIILIGFRGAGKTTVGQGLAQRLGWPFWDLDELIEKKEGCNIKEMVEQKGWDYFRKKEREYLEELGKLEGVVIALGGGAVIHQEAMDRLKEDSLIIYLKTPPEVLAKRIQGDKKSVSQRPSLTHLPLLEEVKKLLQERSPLYEKFAHLVVNSEKKDIIDLIEEITNYLFREVGNGLNHT